jgi:hypothetical protein
LLSVKERGSLHRRRDILEDIQMNRIQGMNLPRLSFTLSIREQATNNAGTIDLCTCATYIIKEEMLL